MQSAEAIELMNCYGVPYAEVLRAVAHVRALFPPDTVKEIWFQGTDKLIVERFALKPEVVNFPFTRRDYAGQR